MTHNFVIYALKEFDERDFREDLPRRFGVGALSISFSKPPTNVADAYAADGAHDMYLMVKPPRTPSKSEEDELISAVRDTTRAVGALSFCPVRGGQTTQEEHRHFFRFWKNKSGTRHDGR